MHNRRIGLAVAIIGLVALAARHPTADIRVFTHDAADPAPHRMQAAVDLGMLGVSFLYTWTAATLR